MTEELIPIPKVKPLRICSVFHSDTFLILGIFIYLLIGGSVVKNPPASAGDAGDSGSIPGSRRFPWRKKQQPTPVFLPGESHGQRSLEGYSPWGRRVGDD